LVRGSITLISKIKILRRPGFWLILVLLVLISLPHYQESLEHPSFLAEMVSALGLTRHAFERVLYLAPIVWAGFLFGGKGSLITSLGALACMLPRAILISEYQTDALFESSAVFIIGNVLAISFSALRKEREYRWRLEKTKRELETSIQIIKQNEKRLESLHHISGTVAQSLELDQVLNSAIDNVVNVMQVDVAWIFLLKEETGELHLAVHRGIPKEFAHGIGRLELGEGLSGSVAQSGKPLFVEDAARDSRLTREVVSRYDIHSMLIVPLTSKGKVNGTLCVAMRGQRQFPPEEIELLAAIGNQVGVAVENAHLYQQQQEIAEQLRLMQENLRLQLHQVSRAQEEERKRISHELHDDSIQELVVLSRQIDALSISDGLTESHRQRLEELLQKTTDIIQDIRRLSQDLRPAALDRLGLIPALEWLASDVTRFSGLNTNVNVKGNPRRFPEEVELMLFRIVQEALRNVWRHAEATRADVTVVFDDTRTTFTIADNGKGFKLPRDAGDLAKDGKLGLAGMQERAQLIGAKLKLQSQPGEGTAITVELPR